MLFESNNIGEDEELIGLDQEEPTEGSDEENTGDEQVESEQPSADETSDPGNGFEIDIDGNKEIIAENDLSKIIKEHRDWSNDRDQVENFRQIKPVIDKIKESQTLKQFIGYSSQGYTDEQIMDGLFLLRHPEYKEMFDNYSKNKPAPEPEKMPEDMTVEEEIEWRVNKALQERLAPVQSQLKTMTEQQARQQQQQQYATVYQNNDNLIMNAVQSELGGIEINATNAQMLQQTFAELYPNENIQTKPLTERQAKLLVREAFGGMKQQTQPNRQAGLLSKTKDLPDIMTGTSGRSLSTGKPNAARELSVVDRKKAVDDFWDKF